MSEEPKNPKIIANMNGGRAPITMAEVRESRAPIAMTKVRDGRSPIVMTPVPSARETASLPKPGDTVERGRGCVPVTPAESQQTGQQTQTPKQSPAKK